jgi:hypothetical protein
MDQSITLSPKVIRQVIFCAELELVCDIYGGAMISVSTIDIRVMKSGAICRRFR